MAIARGQRPNLSPSGSPPRPRSRREREDEPLDAPTTPRGLGTPEAPTQTQPPMPTQPSTLASDAPPPARKHRPRSLPRLALAPLEPAELLYERLHEPSDESPILYRERAYVVDALQTDDDLEEQLEAELSRIRRDWRHRDASQFVQLSLFDHRFHGEPVYPPIATLSWKDWQGRSEIWVRGVRRSTMPPGMSLDSMPPIPRPDRLAAAERRSIEDARAVPLSEIEAISASLSEDFAVGVAPIEREGEPIPLVARVAAGSSSVPEKASEGPPSSSEHIAISSRDAPPNGVSNVEAVRDSPPDSGPGWQSPDRSGEFLIPVPEEHVNAPSSQRVVASEELIGALFERMQELSFVPTISAGADYVLGALAEHIACDGALIHVLDVEAEEFVVMRALGPDSLEVLTRRTLALGSHLSESLRRRATLELGQGDIARCRAYWQALGVIPRHVIASPILRPTKPLGVIELARVTSKGAFSPGQVRALEYVCEQFAEFVADRPIDLARATLYPQNPLT